MPGAKDIGTDGAEGVSAPVNLVRQWREAGNRQTREHQVVINAMRHGYVGIGMDTGCFGLDGQGRP